MFIAQQKKKNSLQEATEMLKTRKPRFRKETARCSVFLRTPNDSLIVIYIHCIKEDVNVKLNYK